ncbi:MAG: helix-turn-helix transcriptional regulator [Rhizobiaceae bacterium]
MGRHQPFIANIESGDRRVDLVELIDLADILGFDVHEIIDELTINK